MVTFAIVAHNEAATVATAVQQAVAAARTADRVLVVDSESSDDTAAKARCAGAEVVSAPIGKGLAMAAAVAAAKSEWICFLDADVPTGSPNYAARLREASEHTEVAHILGEYQDEQPAVPSNTFAIYEPLVASFFPEADGKFGSKPLTGFRVIQRALLRPQRFPTDFGIEAYLNIEIMMSGGTHEVLPIGGYQSRFRYKPHMGREIANAVLDLAVHHGRLTPAARQAWNEWVSDAITVISEYRGTPEERPAFLRRLAALPERPIPPVS